MLFVSRMVLILGIVFTFWAVFVNRHHYSDRFNQEPCEEYYDVFMEDKYALEYQDRVEAVLNGCLE